MGTGGAQVAMSTDDGVDARSCKHACAYIETLARREIELEKETEQRPCGGSHRVREGGIRQTDHDARPFNEPFQAGSNRRRTTVASVA